MQAVSPGAIHHEEIDMRTRTTLLLVSLLIAAPAFADWDPALEAQEQAARQAELRKQQEQERKNQQMKAEALAKHQAGVMAEKRKNLGAAAKGKSDAEVNALYEAKIKSATQTANKTAAEVRSKMSNAQAADGIKQATGISIKDMSNMSDAELEAIGNEMEKRYGGK